MGIPIQETFKKKGGILSLLMYSHENLNPGLPHAINPSGKASMVT
jgi:hypothetical protein